MDEGFTEIAPDDKCKLWALRCRKCKCLVKYFCKPCGIDCCPEWDEKGCRNCAILCRGCGKPDPSGFLAWEDTYGLCQSCAKVISLAVAAYPELQQIRLRGHGQVPRVPTNH